MNGMYLLAPSVCAALGMAMSLLLLLLLRRQLDRPREWTAGVLLAVSVFAMYASTMASTTAAGVGLGAESWQLVLSVRILLSVAAFIPSIILLGWRWSSIFNAGSPVGKTLLRGSLLSSSIIVGLLWLGPTALSTDKRINRIVLVNALIILLIGFRGLLRHRLSVQLRLCMVITRAFYVVGLLVALATPTTMEGPSVAHTVLLLIQQSCILVGIVGSFIFIARFRFADVFVKWSLRLVGLGILATIGAAGLVVIPENAGHTYALLIDAVALFGLIGFAVTSAPLIDRIAERWLLQQADLRGELEQIGSRMLAIESEEDLVASVDSQLVDCLQLTMARTISREELPDALVKELATFGDVVESCGAGSSSCVSGMANAEMLVPVMVDGEMRYVMIICAGLGRRTLLSGEVQFLRAVARQLGVRIHRIETETASRQQALREALLKNQLTEAELRALRAQVNPHFLFNSLNTIADLIVTNPTNAERMTLRLASIFRHVLAQTDRQFMTLREEFDFLRNYLQIEQERFGDRLDVSLYLDPALAHENVPTLLLQPIVENALRHGLAPKGGKGRLEISAMQREGFVDLLVFDNGIGYQSRQPVMVSTKLASHPIGVGLTNTVARLQTMYGPQASLNIESAPMEGCRVSISYPLQVSNYALSHHR